MRSLGIIPARYDSSRFPGKPLVIINGKSMIFRVYEQSTQSRGLDKVIVATDDQRIVDEVKRFGGNVILTSKHHKSGTDRCNEVVKLLEETGDVYDLVVNIQGDEPYIDPDQIEKVLHCFIQPEVQIATLAKKINKDADLFNPNVNKVIRDQNSKALYFSRHPIPYIQNTEQSKWRDSYDFLKHIGIYAYRSDILKKISALHITSLEQAESLEQLRWMENGYKIHVEITDIESIAVDTPEDLLKFSNIS